MTTPERLTGKQPMCALLVRSLTRTVFSGLSTHRSTAAAGCRSAFQQNRRSKMSYTTVERGAPNSLDYRLYIKGANGFVSPFHDIPLHANAEKTVFNMVVEVPRWSNAKMEIATKEKLNPIKQDVKKGNLRYVKNCFPHHGYIWNYGAFPQTWEDPNHRDQHTECKGDNDPIDVCEIGQRVANRGDVIQVKVLGIMALIDEGETDWKILAIDVKDPLAAQMNDIEDIKKLKPGFLEATCEWFKIYKIPDGKPENQFAFEGQAKDKAFALNIITETHEQWRNLVAKKTDSAGIACENVSVGSSPFMMTQEDAQAIVDKSAPVAPAEPINSEVDKWHHITKL
ncbi:inorganic pyrophosphatase-like [Ptychodera flava]|uniref:inorganic pyrophosphatase-like n=1 Tax=Ptychodera flava TaxID=63121 RepID=UPI003969CD8E